MSTSEKNMLNIVLLIVLFVALIYFSQPLNDVSIGPVITMGMVTLQAMIYYIHGYKNQTGIEQTWLQVFTVVSSLIIIVYLFWVHQWLIIKLLYWVLEGSLFYGYAKKLIISKLHAKSK